MADVGMLAWWSGWFGPWRLLALIVLIALIIFWVMYRRRQV